MIPNKQGRPVDIDERPVGWKLTPRQRDEIYQQFLEQFPDRDCDADRARAWITLRAK